MTSLRLCGGILVAMPTAIPEDPLTNRLGTRVGNTVVQIRFHRSWDQNQLFLFLNLRISDAPF